jgi:hypothetical protein
MIQTKSHLTLTNGFAFGMSEWGNVIHKVKKSTWSTECGVPVMKFSLSTAEVEASGLNLCNGCFR